MKKLFKTLLVTAAIFAFVIISALAILGVRMSGQIKALDRSAIELSRVADGVYNGRCETDLVKAEVRVTVSDGTIQDVEIVRHECGKGHPAEEIVKDMIKKNDVEVDAVTGATLSSEVIKAAVRTALRAP